MHQIRAHLAAIGAPILGDVLYGGPALPGLARHFLHAARLGLVSPASQAAIVVESPLPAELDQAWQAARSR
jgi:23S rRNA pseudouridine1911/1915/1917 synthase